MERDGIRCLIEEAGEPMDPKEVLIGAGRTVFKCLLNPKLPDVMQQSCKGVR